MRIILMGVSGCGKTSLGQALAAQYAYTFIDGDELHPESNIQKMTHGQALNDHDREPWLQALRIELVQHTDVILAASLLKEQHRQKVLNGLDNVRLYHLHGSYQLIFHRMQQRKHFMSPQMLKSQFTVLEPPLDVQVLDITKSIDELCGLCHLK